MIKHVCLPTRFNTVMRRTMAAHLSSVRRVTTRKLSRVRNDRTVYSRSELDSHADTVVLGGNCVILNYSGRECDVSPYTDAYDAIKGVPIVKGATAWTSNMTGETFILVFNEALWMGEVMEHSLINLNQLRHHGIGVQDNPYSATQLHIAAEDEEFILPLESEGTTVFFPSQKNCRRVDILSSHPMLNGTLGMYPFPIPHIEWRKD